MPIPASSLPCLALIGVTGYGMIYLDLVRSALRAGTIRLSAAVIINPADVPAVVAELRAAGATIYASADEMFACEAGRIDLCLIPVGIQWHARLTVAALRAGMHVLVEKPLAGSVADCTAIRRAEAETGRWVAVGFQDFYAPETHSLKARILAGELGRLREVRMIGLWPRPRSYFTRNHWAGRRAADGAAVLDSPLNNAFAHFVNLALLLAGPSATDSASVRFESAELLRAHRIEMFDTAVVRGVSTDGVRFWFGVSHATRALHQPEILFRGEAGDALWRHEDRCDFTFADGRRQSIPLPAAAACRRAMFEAVLARLHDSSVPVCTTALAARHVEFVESLQAVSPVQSVPESLLDFAPAPNAGEIPCVPGLDAALGHAFAQGTPLGPLACLAETPLVTA